MYLYLGPDRISYDNAMMNNAIFLSSDLKDDVILKIVKSNEVTELAPKITLGELRQIINERNKPNA